MHCGFNYLANTNFSLSYLRQSVGTLKANYHTLPGLIVSLILYGMPINYLSFLPFILYVCFSYMP
jgi:hypothetical protein